MKLNRKVEYALMALRHMNQKKPGVLTAVKEIAEAYGCSFDVTARVMQKMVQADILRSVQGAQGGYQIVKDLESLSFYQLNEVIVGPLEIAKCLHASGCELQASCNIVTPVQKLNERLKDFYQSLPVSELLDSGLDSGEAMIAPRTVPQAVSPDVCQEAITENHAENSAVHEKGVG